MYSREELASQVFDALFATGDVEFDLCGIHIRAKVAKQRLIDIQQQAGGVPVVGVVERGRAIIADDFLLDRHGTAGGECFTQPHGHGVGGGLVRTQRQAAGGRLGGVDFLPIDGGIERGIKDGLGLGDQGIIDSGNQSGDLEGEIIFHRTMDDTFEVHGDGWRVGRIKEIRAIVCFCREICRWAGRTVQLIASFDGEFFLDRTDRPLDRNGLGIRDAVGITGIGSQQSLMEFLFHRTIHWTCTG